MKKISRKKHLEMYLQKVESHPNPKVELEQYTTPSVIASDLLWMALSLDDIKNKNILDLGCGTGIFTIGAYLLGAKRAIGVDIDCESINLAKSYGAGEFICEDIFNLKKLNTDTIFQNPPFGSQKRAKKGIDLDFVKKAYELSPKTLYSFHMASTEKFLLKFYEDLSFDVTHVFKYEFPISKTYKFHNMEKKNVNVIVIRAII